MTARKAAAKKPAAKKPAAKTEPPLSDPDGAASKARPLDGSHDKPAPEPARDSLATGIDPTTGA